MKRAIASFCIHLQWLVVVSILYCGTLFLGGVPAASLYALRLLIVVSLVLQVILLFSEDDYLKAFPRSIVFPIFFFGSFLALTYVQHHVGSDLLGDARIGTVNVFETYDSMVQLIVYFCFFIICFSCTY